jgi:UDP-glucose 4-epimerase
MNLAELATAFEGKRVLITGGLGFIGSNLARELVDAGSDVLIVDSLVPEYGGRLENVVDIEDRLRVNFSDVRDEHSLRYLVRGQDIVFNLAGQTSHLDSMVDPYTDLEINCRSQLSILEACRHNNPEVKVVFASTRQIYGRPRYLPVDEEHPISPVDVNGINKTSGEWYHLLYGEVYSLRVAVLRLTNTFGPRMRVKDARQTFLGWWLRQVLTGEEILVYGDGTQKRDFNYVDDALSAFLLVGAREEANGRIYNLGSDQVTTLRALAELLIELNGGGTYRTVPFPSDRKSIDIGDYYASTERISRELGWRAHVGLEDGLARTLAFYREHGPSFWADT